MSKRSKQSSRVATTSSRAASKATAQRPAPPDRADGTSAGVGLRVLCVDDHAVLIEGLKAQFAIKGRIQVVGSLGSANRLLEETARLHPDVILLDIEMPGPDVFEMADRLRHKHPRVRFIFLSAHVRDGYLAAAYKCGAWGYFAKGDDLEAIVAGVEEVARSSAGTFVMGSMVRQRCRLAAATTRAGRSKSRSNTDPASGGEVVGSGKRPQTALETLTSREIEVLRLIGKGRSRTEIAQELSRSVKTIDGHQERMLKKLGITSRADLMRFAIREGFAEA